MPSSFQNLAMTISFTAQMKPNNPALPDTIAISDQTFVKIGAGSSTTFDGVFTVMGTVTAGSDVAINLASLVDPGGNAISADKIVGIKIFNAGGAGNLAHGGGSTPIYSLMPLTIGPGDSFGQTMAGTPLSVNGGAGHLLKLSADSGTIPYVVTIPTRSA